MMVLPFQIKTKKAYTLIEMIVSLAIIGLIMTLFLNILLLASQVTYKGLARSNVREEISSVSNLISRDIQNAQILLDCGQAGVSNSCQLVSNDRNITWELCDTSLCKKEISSTGESVTKYRSDSNIIINALTFERGFSSSSSNAKSNILVTIVASHETERLQVNNIVQQFSASTRNYEIKR